MKTKLLSIRLLFQRYLLLFGTILFISQVGLSQENLTISILGDTDVDPGETITYTITYNNSGDTYAENVVIINYLPAGDQYTYIQSIPQGTYNSTNNTITWDKTKIPSLANLGSGPFTITVKIKAGKTNSSYYPTAYYMPLDGLNVLNDSVSIESDYATTPVWDYATTDVYMTCLASIVDVQGVVKSATGSLTYHLIKVENQGNIYDNFDLYVDPDNLQGYDCDGTGPLLFDELDGYVVNLDDTSAPKSGWLAPGEAKYFYVKTIAPVGTTPNGDSWNCMDIMAESTVCGDVAPFAGQVSTEIVGNVNYPLINVSKLASPDPVERGEIVTYTIYIFNSNEKSQAVADNVVVTDNFPSGVTYWSATPTPASYSSTQATWNYASIGYGPTEAKTITLELLVDDGGGCTGTLTNNVSVTYDDGGPVTTSVNSDIVSHPDLVLTKVADKDEAFPGDQLTYTLTYSNDGNCPVDDVQITDIFDIAHASLYSNPDGGTVTDNTIVWDIGTLNPGDESTISFTIEVLDASNFQPGTTILDNVATIEGTIVTEEVDYFNNTSYYDVAVKILPDLVITKSISPDLVPGEQSTYTVTVTNTGDVAASNVVIEDYLPTGVSAVTISDSGTESSGVVTWPTIPSFAVGHTEAYTLTVTTDCSTTGTLTNIASVSSNNPDKNEDDNDFSLESVVVNDFSAGTIFSTGQTICYNEDASVIGSSSDASGGDGNYTYQWKYSTDGFATAGVIIADSIRSSYVPGALTQTTSFRRYAKDGNCNDTFVLSSGEWTVTVRDEFNPGSIDAPGETICYNADASSIGNITEASGGDGTISYQWRSSTDDFATSSVISGATDKTYDPGNLTQTASFKRYAKDNVCNTTFEPTVETWLVTVRDNFSAGSISSLGEDICYNTNASEISVEDPTSGGDGNYTYQWESSTDEFATVGTVISGANLSTYNPGVLTQTTSYRRYAKDGTCNTTFELTTGVWTVTVHPVPRLTINSITVDESVGTANLTVVLSDPLPCDVTFDVATANNTAISGSDYSGIGTTQYTIPANTVSKNISVSITDDTDLESTESFYVNISNPTNATISVSQGVVTINDNDSATAGLSVTTNGNETGPVDIVYTVTLSKVNNTASTITFEFDDLESGTATSGSDYTAVPAAAQISVFVGSSTGTITIPVIDDSVLEPDTETLIAKISGSSNASVTIPLVGESATATILDNDAASVTIADGTAIEGDNLTMVVTLNNDVQGDVVVDVSFSDGTTSSNDFNHSVQTITFAGGTAGSQNVVIPTTEDAVLEANETFTASLSLGTGNVNPEVGVSDPSTGTINNDDSATVTIADVSGNEDDGAITLTATLDHAVQGGFTVNVSTGDGTGTIADSDYTSVSGQTLTFAGTAGEEQTFTVTPTADTKLESDETVSISQSGLAATTLAVDITDGATVTINNDDAAAVTIANVSGNEDDGAITLTATLDYAVQGGFTVNVSTADGTATIADSDYTAVSGQTLTFTGIAGETQTFTVTPTADTKLEANETVLISQSGLAATTLAVNISDGATVTINNDDSAAVTIADVSGNEDDGAITLTATLDYAVQGGFTVNVSTADGTATIADSDYSAVSGQTLTFAGTEGEEQTFTVTPISDTKLESNETVSISQSGLAATTLSVDISDGATVTILDDDAASVTIADVSGNEDDGVITVTLLLDKAVQGGFSVDVSTSDGTATTANSDYTAIVNQTITFSGTAGEEQTFTVMPTADGTLEPDETLTVSMGNLSIVLPVDITDVASVTILDDDAASVTIADGTATEGDNLTMVVTLNNDVQGDVVVDVSFSDGTTSSNDFNHSVQTITFTGGTAGSQNVVIPTTEDAVLEADETFTASLSLGTGNVNPEVGVSDTSTGTINNDDSAAVTIADVSGNEDAGAITVTATLDHAVQGGFTVNVSTADGTATLADSDYPAVSGQALTFTGTAGETQTFTVTPTVDTKLEADETLTVSMGNLSTSLPVDITDGATVTILNDDAAKVTIADVSGDEDNGAITLTATLDHSVQGGFTVNVSTADGTATIADSDYSAVSGQTLTFTGTEGETQTFTVTPTVDTKLEADETVSISQSGLAATTLAVDISDGAIVTILNDDAASVTIADVSGNEDDGAVTLTATLDYAVQGGFTVNVSTADGTATIADSDYTAVSGQTLTFAGTAGEEQTFTVTPTADTKLESNETVLISQSGLAATTLAVDITDGAIVTINNDDSAAVTIADASGNEDDGTITLTATLDYAVQGGFTVNVSTADGTATIADSDYAAVSGQTLTFTGTANESHTFTVTPTSDTKLESNETVLISQSGLAATTLEVDITDGAILTINNDDSALLSISASDGDVDETGTNNGQFTVSLSSPSSTLTTVSYVVSGTATEGLDYTSLNGSLDIPASSTSAVIDLTILSDVIIEADETVIVTLSSITAGHPQISLDTSNDEATITIPDDDIPVIECPGNISRGTDSGVCSSLVSIPVQEFDTNWPGAVLSWTIKNSGNTIVDSGEGQIGNHTFDTGSWNVTYLAYDNISSHTATCSFNVVVADDDAPVPSLATLPTTTGQCSVNVSAPTAIDNCAGTITGTTSDPVSYNAQGTYTINWTYNDGNGNTSSQVQTVIIDDTTPPSIVCQGNLIRTTAPGVCEMNVTVQNAVATDNCGATVVGVRDDGKQLTDPYPAGATLITWTATDIGGNKDVCTQAVTVKSPPVAYDDEADSFEDTPVNINVMDNDFDCDDNLQANSVQIIVPPLHGTAVVKPDGSIDFLSEGNFYGYDELTYQVCDADGLCDEAKVEIRVGPVNDQPVAVDDYFIRNDESANILSNDSDPDGDGIVLNLTPVSGPYFGEVTLNPDGTFTYTPDDFYFEKDSFVYEICDDYAEPLCDQAQVVIVNDRDDDGIDDLTDIDDDNDGIPDVDEGDRTVDSDNDGFPDSLDIDSDNDGIPDNIDGQSKQTYHMPLGTDGDKDGWDDAYDPDNLGTPMDLPDSDQDGLADFVDPDSDDDTVGDAIEVYDFNFDGEPDVEATGKDVNEDGLDDGFEAGLITPAMMKDFDGDGIDNWRDADDDDDGLMTAIETEHPGDRDGDGLVNYLDIDSDDDGILDNVEAQPTASVISFSGNDTDGDGLDDAFDPNNNGVLLNGIDTDDDGTPDYLDDDTDNDLVPDYIEAQDTDFNGEEDQAFTDLDQNGNGLDDLFESYTPPLQDADSDGIPDWRDDDDDGDAILSRDEDENGDGDPTNDDCNWNEIPNYLDPESCDLLIPNAFSPNGDGINDYLRIRGIHTYATVKIEVYSRWGVKVYENDDYGNVPKDGDPGAWWDGRANVNGNNKDEILPAGTYYVILILDDSSVYKGFVYINR